MTSRDLRVACIQLNAGKDWCQNWARLERQLQRAIQTRPDFIVLPENFIARAPESQMRAIAKAAVPFVLSELEKISRTRNVNIIAGSIPEILSGSKKWGNTSVVFSKQGKVILRYRKMHLFDVDLPNVKVQESKIMRPGKTAGYFKADGFRCGVGICYDLRFPEYFRLLSQKGAEVVFLPANFTAETGKTAWEVLLRARAIENQCYIVAAGQCGRHPGSGIQSYGNSMIIDPLGRVIRRASKLRAEVLTAKLNRAFMGQLRACLPVLKHRKIRTY